MIRVYQIVNGEMGLSNPYNAASGSSANLDGNRGYILPQNTSTTQWRVTHGHTARDPRTGEMAYIPRIDIRGASRMWIIYKIDTQIDASDGAHDKLLIEVQGFDINEFATTPRVVASYVADWDRQLQTFATPEIPVAIYAFDYMSLRFTNENPPRSGNSGNGIYDNSIEFAMWLMVEFEDDQLSFVDCYAHVELPIMTEIYQPAEGSGPDVYQADTGQWFLADDSEFSKPIGNTLVRGRTYAPYDLFEGAQPYIYTGASTGESRAEFYVAMPGYSLVDMTVQLRDIYAVRQIPTGEPPPLDYSNSPWDEEGELLNDRIDWSKVYCNAYISMSDREYLSPPLPPVEHGRPRGTTNLARRTLYANTGQYSVFREMVPVQDIPDTYYNTADLYTGAPVAPQGDLVSYCSPRIGFDRAPGTQNTYSLNASIYVRKGATSAFGIRIIGKALFTFRFRTTRRWFLEQSDWGDPQAPGTPNVNPAPRRELGSEDVQVGSPRDSGLSIGAPVYDEEHRVYTQKQAPLIWVAPSWEDINSRELEIEQLPPIMLRNNNDPLTMTPSYEQSVRYPYGILEGTNWEHNNVPPPPTPVEIVYEPPPFAVRVTGPNRVTLYWNDRYGNDWAPIQHEISINSHEHPFFIKHPPGLSQFNLYDVPAGEWDFQIATVGINGELSGYSPPVHVAVPGEAGLLWPREHETIYTTYPRNQKPVAGFTYTVSGGTATFRADSTPSTTRSYDPDEWRSEDELSQELAFWWGFGDGTTSGAGPQVTHTYDTAGPKNVRLTVVDRLGGTSSTVQVVSSAANQGPTANFSASVNLRQVSFNAGISSDPDNNIKEYRWDFGHGDIEVRTSSAPFTHTYPSVGTFTVTLVVVDTAGLSHSIQKTINTASQPPQAFFIATPSGFVVNVDASASSDPDGPIVAYEWDWGDGANTTGVTSSHTYATVGNKTIKLTVKDEYNSSATATKTVTVLGPPPAALTMTNPQGGSNLVQLGWTGWTANVERVRLYITPQGETTPTHWFSTSASSDVLSTTFFTIASGTHTVHIKAVDAQGQESAASNSGTVTVSAGPNDTWGPNS